MILFISHDVYFIRNLANHVVHVKNGRLTPYPGDYQYYVDKTAARQAIEAANLARLAVQEPSRNEPRPSQDRKEQKRLAAEQRQARSRERRTIKDLVACLEREIAALEVRQTELTADLENPETYESSERAVSINLEMKDVLEETRRLTDEWEAAATRLAAFDAETEE